MIWTDLDRWSRHFTRDFSRMQRAMDWMAERSSEIFPAVDVAVTPENCTLTAELPGVDPQGVELRIEQDALTISGSRDSGQEENARYIRKERRTGKFSRTIQLPYRVEQDRIEAVSRNGRLTVTLPRAENEKPRKIAVKTA